MTVLATFGDPGAINNVVPVVDELLNREIEVICFPIGYAFFILENLTEKIKRAFRRVIF